MHTTAMRHLLAWCMAVVNTSQVMKVNYLVSAIMACVCASLGYAMLDIHVFEKITILKAAKENQDEAKKAIGKKLLLVLIIILFAISFAVTWFVFRRVSEPINIAKMLIALVCLVGSACVDFREHRIPNLFPAIMAVSGVVLLAAGYFTQQVGATSYIVSSAIAAGGCVLFLTVASFLSKGGIGAGDIKLLGALGLLCGVYTICETAFISITLCALASIPLLLLKKKTIKGALPFGPFVLIGFAASVILFSF